LTQICTHRIFHRLLTMTLSFMSLMW